MSDTLKALRSATREPHTRLEAQLEIAVPGAGVQEYLHYLQDLWGWIQPFEDKLWQVEWPQEIQALSRTGKLSWIEADLRFACFDAQQIRALPVAAFDPDLSTLAGRFGVAYVIEGSQLGTKVLQRRLERQLGSWSPRWLEGYGAKNAENWRAFVQCAELSLTTPSCRQQAARSAAEAFSSLAGWFEKRRNARAATARQECGPQTSD